MKLIEALKQIGDLQRKASDLRDLVKQNCALSNVETPSYGTVEQQRKKIKSWIQAHSDIMKEILRLSVAVLKTNLETKVTIEIDGKNIEKTISEWIYRRRSLANGEFQMWDMLTDRGIVEGMHKGPSGDTFELKIVRFYDPETRDHMKAVFSSEPTIIDGKLEVINAVTDLIEN